jgi:hypothetical protein
MKLKTLIALAVAGAFAVPFAAQASASGDRIILAAGGPSGAGSTGSGMTGGTPSTQSSGEPKAAMQKSDANRAASGATGGAAPAFTTLDTNSDGQISQAEWDAHYRSGAAASGGASTSPSSGAASSGASTSPAPSGPGTKSQAGPGSDTATTPGTSGKGKAQ